MLINTVHSTGAREKRTKYTKQSAIGDTKHKQEELNEWYEQRGPVIKDSNLAFKRSFHEEYMGEARCAS